MVTFGFLILGVNQPGPAPAQTADSLVMVVNPANVSGDISFGDARKLLVGETGSWHNGAKVTIVLQPAGSPDRALILKKVCGMNEASYTRLQLQASFTGQTAATIHEAASDAAVKSFVKANPGAVGFLPKAEVDASVKSVLSLN
jgi:ABC-type phosphate transport system substrate-binding protein